MPQAQVRARGQRAGRVTRAAAQGQGGRDPPLLCQLVAPAPPCAAAMRCLCLRRARRCPPATTPIASSASSWEGLQSTWRASAAGGASCLLRAAPHTTQRWPPGARGGGAGQGEGARARAPGQCRARCHPPSCLLTRASQQRAPSTPQHPTAPHQAGRRSKSWWRCRWLVSWHPTCWTGEAPSSEMTPASLCRRWGVGVESVRARARVRVCVRMRATCRGSASGSSSLRHMPVVPRPLTPPHPPVGRDGRHAGRAAVRQGARRAVRGADQHRGLRHRSLHALRRAHQRRRVWGGHSTVVCVGGWVCRRCGCECGAAFGVGGRHVRAARACRAARALREPCRTAGLAGPRPPA